MPCVPNEGANARRLMLLKSGIQSIRPCSSTRKKRARSATGGSSTPRNSAKPMNTFSRFSWLMVFALSTILGCRTTIPIINTTRSGTQQLLVNSSADAVICAIDFSPLTGLLCYLDTTGLGAASDGYVEYRIRKQMIRHGVRLSSTPDAVDVIVEAGLAAYGTDSQLKSSGIVGASSVPDMEICVEGRQFGVAKLELFAWDRESGACLWESQTFRADNYQQHRQRFGGNPEYSGSIVHPANKHSASACRKRGFWSRCK